MLTLVVLTSLVLHSNVNAAPTEKTVKFNYQSAEISKMVADYAAASGQRFVVDDQIKGRVTIINPRPVSLTEAFNQLSSALAGNGIGIAANEDVMHVMPARFLQRNNIPVVKELPAASPERMVTWVYQAKHVTAESISTQLRILSSRDGELLPYPPRNQLIISDWTTSLQRIAAVLKEVDVPGPEKK